MIIQIASRLERTSRIPEKISSLHPNQPHIIDPEGQVTLFPFHQCDRAKRTVNVQVTERFLNQTALHRVIQVFTGRV